jgi:hypothetical protein
LSDRSPLGDGRAIRGSHTTFVHVTAQNICPVSMARASLPIR